MRKNNNLIKFALFAPIIISAMMVISINSAYASYDFNTSLKLCINK